MAPVSVPPKQFPQRQSRHAGRCLDIRTRYGATHFGSTRRTRFETNETRSLGLLQATPFGDEQRRCLGDLADRFEVHALVEAVDVIGLWAVDQRRDAGIEAEKTVVGG